MTRPHPSWLSRGVLSLAAITIPLLPGRLTAAPAEVKLDRQFLAALVEKLPPCPFAKDGQYRGTVHAYRLVAIEPQARRFLVVCQVEGDFRPPIPSPRALRTTRDGTGPRDPTDARWRRFRFEVRAGVHLEPGADGLPRFRVEVEEIKRRELEGVAGTLARVLGKLFDEMVTQVAAGKAALLNERLNAEVIRRVEALKPYGIFCGIDYGRDQVVLRFDLTRFKSEGIAGYVFPTAQPGTVPLYRWVHRRHAAHLYTTNPFGIDQTRFLSEGIACHVYHVPYPQTVPLYHWRSPKDHFYTTAPDGDGAYRGGYRPAGIACYVFPAPQPGTVPLYRFLDPRTGLHFYTLHPHAEFAK